MVYVFTLPDIGEGIAEAELISWLVKAGDSVELDQPIAVVETDKAAVEMPAPAAGTIQELSAKPGDMVEVGQTLIIIDDGSAGGPPPDTVVTPAIETTSQAVSDKVFAASSSTQNGTATEPQLRRSPKATPATRRLAREKNVSLETVTGTGPGGRITDADVVAVADSLHDDVDAAVQASSAGAPADRSARPLKSEQDERIPVRGLRRKTAESMTRAAQEIPHTVVFQDADIGGLLELRRKLKPRAANAGINLTLTPFLVKAVALALVAHPMANSSFDKESSEIIVRGRRNIGVAANTPDGLVLPVIKDADAKPLMAIAREVDQLSKAARDRSVPLSDLQGGTFTITNHGPLGGKYGTPIIKPPEAGIAGFGRASDQAVVRDGQIVIRTMLPISFASDHRIVDGDLALGFCLTLIDLLEDPVQLLVEEG